MKNLVKLHILSMAAVFILQACSSDQKPVEVTSFPVPELLQRSEKIQLGKEWDYVQNEYSDQRQAINRPSARNEAALALAELFVREARVTGEHGHYYPAALSMVEIVLADDALEADMRFRALTTRAGVQLSLHEFQSALTTAQDALKLNTVNARLYGVLVDCYVELGLYDQAVEAADKMVSIKPDIRSYSRISYLRELHGDMEGAQAAMTMAVKSGFPGYEETAWAMLTLGNMYLKEGQFDRAEKVFSEILTVRENYPFAVSALGEVAYAKGNLSEAEKLQQEAMDIIPEVGFYTAMAAIYKDQGRNEEFESIMSEVFEMLADDEASGHNMNMEYAHIYMDLLDNPSEALNYLTKEYEKRPRNIEVNKMMAEVYAQLGQQQTANKYLSEASITQAGAQNTESAI